MESKIITIIETILKKSGFHVEEIFLEQGETAGQRIFQIKTKEPKHLIGIRGDTLHAIDYLVKRIAEKAGIEEMFLVDVDGYRSKQIKDIQQKALILAERARSFQYDVELTPMSSYERLIVHSTLQNAPNIKTESRGEGKDRRIVIKYTPSQERVS